MFPINFNLLSANNPNWTVTIRPAAGAIARTTSGDPGTSNPLILLNGADRIIFDGRPGVQSLTVNFANTLNADLHLVAGSIGNQSLADIPLLLDLQRILIYRPVLICELTKLLLVCLSG
jgi:hypothetical protein